MMNNLKKGKISMEVIVPSIERFLNVLWQENIELFSVKRKSITTLRIEVSYEQYEEVVAIVEKMRGKVKVINKSGVIYVIKKIINKKSLIAGAFIFIGIIYYLSTYVWSVEITTENNLSPFEVRRDLEKLGVKAGMKKNDIDVYDLERRLETVNDEILWLRIRIEGSTLKVLVKEKVNPPELSDKQQIGNIIAERGGEIKRIFVTSGTAMVAPGDIVNKNDLLIQGVRGIDENIHEVPAKGVVIANTFYEMSSEVQITGEEFLRTKKEDSDIYIELFGAKIYLKKAINNFEYYDKIEDKSKLIDIVKYYEKEKMKINIEEKDAVEVTCNKLQNALQKKLSNEAKIVDKDVTASRIDDGKILVKAIFVVEQNIALVVNS
ncbi:sporulation protein YqfD [Clostridium sp. MSJ-8]|uniref:sporulation protein YqfD n=1 Tax=Clostridium sp. MSJ-8 TaxID=2841510 RepID=UPI001C0F30F9|nr:sporulation protein YqfD [Clostridium sp. MSJ-8]MBU5486613.1 sporulation protein YqfD [Clostridium sp. MSJ-8]